MINLFGTFCETYINPGDNWTCKGLLYLLSRLQDTYPEKSFYDYNNYNYVIKYAGRKCNINGRDFSEIFASGGKVIIIGTPQYHCLSEYKFRWDYDLYEYFDSLLNVQIMKLAGGCGGYDYRLTEEEYAEMMSADGINNRIVERWRDKAILVTVRDRYAKAYLDRIGIRNYLLPCFAIFVPRYYNITNYENVENEVLITLPWIEIIKEIPEKIQKLTVFFKLKEILTKKKFKVKFLVHSEYDISYLQEMQVDTSDILFPVLAYDIMRCYIKPSIVISCRTHGSVIASALMKKRIINVALDLRSSLCDEMDGVQSIDIREITEDKLLEMIEEKKEVDVKNRIRKYEETEKKYLELISENWFREV